MNYDPTMAARVWIDCGVCAITGGPITIFVQVDTFAGGTGHIRIGFPLHLLMPSKKRCFVIYLEEISMTRLITYATLELRAMVFCASWGGTLYSRKLQTSRRLESITGPFRWLLDSLAGIVAGRCRSWLSSFTPDWAVIASFPLSTWLFDVYLRWI